MAKMLEVERSSQPPVGKTSQNSGSDDNDPLRIKFTNDYNIMIVHGLVMGKFERTNTELAAIESDMQVLRDRRKEPLTYGESLLIKTKLEKLQRLYDHIASGVDRDTYLEKSKEYIEAYRKSTAETHATGRVAYDRSKVNIIINYLELSKQFIDIDYVHEVRVPATSVCKGCYETLEDPVNNDSGYQTCPNCGVIRQVGTMSKSIETSSEVTSTKEYSDEKNFYKALRRYQGLQKVTFDIEQVCGEIDAYLQTQGYEPASHYKALEPDIYGKKAGTDSYIIEEALEAIGRTSLYESSNLIGHHLWGWVLPDLQDKEELIMEDYRETQAVFDSLPPEVRDRESCLSTQLRVYRQVQLRGQLCRPCDFKLPSQRESLRKQDAIWKIMCDGCTAKCPHIYYIPM